jgi:hypothetical protein
MLLLLLLLATPLFIQNSPANQDADALSFSMEEWIVNLY